MLKVNQKQNSIYLTRGDNASLTFGAIDSSGHDYEIQSGDKVEFTVRSTLDTAPVIRKAAVGSWSININPEDTKGLAFGNYIYDVQLTFGNGWVETIITPSLFIIGEEVS